MAIADIEVPMAVGPRASGVQPWSSAEQYVVFSIDNESDWQARLTFEQFLADRSIGFKAVLGSYKGVEEHSWVVNSRDWPLIRDWQPFEFQESILHLGAWDKGARKASLYYAGNPSLTPIGWFQQVSAGYAKRTGNWTLDGTDYYATLAFAPGKANRK